MVALTEILYGNFITNPYLRFLFILVIFYIISKLLVIVVLSNIKRVTKKTKTEVDDLILDKIHRPAVLFLMLFGVKIAVGVFELSEKTSTIFQHIFNTAIIVLIFYSLMAIVVILLSSWGKRWAEKTESSLDDDLLPLLNKSAKAAFIVIGAIFVLKEWNVDVSGLLAGVGVAGLAIGFAIKDSLANIFGGISIILDKTFKVNDVVKLESGNTGTITDIGLRSTRIRTWDNELLIIPNGQLANSIIQNYKKPDLSARGTVKFGVEYGSDIDKVKKIVTDTLKKIPKVVKNNPKKPVDVLFLNMGDFALECEARFWVSNYGDKFSTKVKATGEIYKALEKSKIGIPFPTRTVYNKKG